MGRVLADRHDAARALEIAGFTTVGWIVALGAAVSMAAVLLVFQYGQPRIFFAMARDGLLPHSIFGVVHDRFRTPHRSTILTGVAICLVSGVLPIRVLEEMVSIGTLMAFILVCISVLMLRITRPDVHRPFRCPVVFVVAPLGVLVNLAMMAFLPLDTWLRLGIWGLAIRTTNPTYQALEGGLAQATVDQLVTAGVRGILNFAPSKVIAPKRVKVITLDIAMELARLPDYIPRAEQAAEGAGIPGDVGLHEGLLAHEMPDIRAAASR